MNRLTPFEQKPRLADKFLWLRERFLDEYPQIQNLPVVAHVAPQLSADSLLFTACGHLVACLEGLEAPHVDLPLRFPVLFSIPLHQQAERTG